MSKHQQAVVPRAAVVKAARTMLNGNQRTVGSYSVWDVYASYKPISNLTLLFGIRNVFDTSPPFSNAAGEFCGGLQFARFGPVVAKLLY
jgi:outer membrane receptor protein involved in Fe transport